VRRSNPAAERNRRRAESAPAECGRRGRDDRGSASVEFLTASVLLLVPIVYLVIVIATVQSAALAIEGAARQGARVFVQSPSVELGAAAATRALELSLSDHGVDAETRVTISCAPVPNDCLARRAWVTVQIDARVPLPLIPGPFTSPPAIPLLASATQQVSRFGGGP
jgi:hypothetical protein